MEIIEYLQKKSFKKLLSFKKFAMPIKFFVTMGSWEGRGRSKIQEVQTRLFPEYG
jgi:hypothetical protein